MQHLILIWQHGWPGLGHWSECPVCHSKVSCFVFLFWCLLCAHMSLWRTDFSYDMFLCKDCLLVFFWYHFPFRVPNPPKPPKGGVNHMLAKFWNWYFFKAANLIESGSQSCLWVVKYYLYPNLYVYLCRKVNRTFVFCVTRHNHVSCDCGLWPQSVATAAYRALETETTVR